jgi:DNA-directed RNA polymerase subunit N (RpoN/RPB10)
MGGVHTETRAASGGHAPLKCEACGKALEDPYTVTVNLLNTDTDMQGAIEVPVCDEECARKYMFRVQNTLIMKKMKMGEGS